MAIHKRSSTWLDVIKAPITNLLHKYFIGDFIKKQLQWNEELTNFINERNELVLDSRVTSLRDFLRIANEGGYYFTRDYFKKYSQTIKEIHVTIGPFNQVKEQMGAKYGQKFAQKGYVFLAFDHLGYGDEPMMIIGMDLLQHMRLQVDRDRQRLTFIVPHSSKRRDRVRTIDHSFAGIDRF